MTHEPERIERAAIRHLAENYSVKSPGRHCDVIAEMAKLGFGPECMYAQGFLTNTGRFVDRYEARRIATLAGQVNEKTKTSPTNLLFSEDLW